MSAKSFRAECETRALRCVEELLETGITEQQLLRAGEVLSAAQYADVVEERNIEHLCGYPLCNEAIKSFPQQKYHVSVKNKQVYDLTERKKFCSEECYKCSEYVMTQLPTLPLWSRSDTKPIKLIFLSSSKTARSLTGDSVSKQPSHQVHSTAMAAVAPSPHPQCPSHNPPLLSELPKLNSIKENPSPPKPATQTQQIAIGLEENFERASLKAPGPPQVSQVSKLLSAFSTWVSVPPPCASDMNPPSQDGAAEDNEEEKGGKEKTRKKEGDGESGQEESEDKSSVADRETSKNHSSVFLPPVDSVNVGHMQHKLFLGQLKKHLSTVCSKLCLTFHTVLPRVTQTVSKFRFDRHCITFRPAEWRIIIVVLLMVLAYFFFPFSLSPSSCRSCGKEDTDFVHGSVVNQWLQDIKATEQDLKLMLATFSSLN